MDGGGPLRNRCCLKSSCHYTVINIFILVQDNLSENVLFSCNVWYKLAVTFAALAIVMIISTFPEIEDALMLAPSETFQGASIDSVVVFSHTASWLTVGM